MYTLLHHITIKNVYFPQRDHLYTCFFPIFSFTFFFFFIFRHNRFRRRGTQKKTRKNNHEKKSFEYMKIKCIFPQFCWYYLKVFLFYLPFYTKI